MIPLWKGWWHNMDEVAQPVALSDALAAMKENNQIPEGFLYRVIVTEGDDISPFTTSLYGLSVTHEMELVRQQAQHGEITYEIFDLLCFLPFDAMEQRMKDTDAILNQIVKQSKESNHIGSLSLAVHFVNRPPEEEE